MIFSTKAKKGIRNRRKRERLQWELWHRFPRLSLADFVLKYYRVTSNMARGVCGRAGRHNMRRVNLRKPKNWPVHFRLRGRFKK